MQQTQQQMLRKVEQRLHAMIGAHNREPLLLAVSGGADSLALLLIVHRILGRTYPLHVIHVHHGLRGQEADDDARHVQKMATAINIPVYTKHVDTARYAKEHHCSIEEAGRELRLACYFDCAQEKGIEKILVGHHQDDMIETALYRMSRGTGLLGLVQSQRPETVFHHNTGVCTLLRPLCDLTRDEIQDYLKSQKILFCDDKSNQSLRFARNRIRRQVIPAIEQVHPQARKNIQRCLSLLQEDFETLQNLRKERVRDLAVRDVSGVVLSCKKLREYSDHEIQAMVMLACAQFFQHPVQWCAEHLKSIVKQVHGESPSSVVHLPNHRVCERRYDMLCIKDATDQKYTSFAYALQSPFGDIVIPEINQRVCFTTWQVSDSKDILAEAKANTYRRTCYLDAQRLTNRLLIRTRKAADRIVPLGHRSAKKLKNILIDHKVFRKERDRLPVFVSQEKIVWLPGLVIADHAKIDASTRTVLKIEIKDL